MVSYNEGNRINWIKSTLNKIPKGFSILDAGAGEQQFKKYCSHLKYVSQDFAQYDGKGNSKGLQTEKWDQSNLDIISDITKIPVKNKSFDSIMCTEVFEHIPEPALAIKEFSRILKKNGFLLITAPFCSLTHFAPYHFSTGFNKYFYEKILVENGFEIIEITHNGNYFDYLIQEVCRIPFMVENYSSVKKTNLFEKIIFKLMNKILNKFSNADSGSNELLCFGYHVFAKKVK
jgi:ubiquinone/menaquinone biosynthesis C-methylase UbiE